MKHTKLNTIFALWIICLISILPLVSALDTPIEAYFTSQDINNFNEEPTAINALVLGTNFIGAGSIPAKGKMVKSATEVMGKVDDIAKNEVKWFNHKNKHMVKGNNIIWKEIVKSTKKGSAKYLPSLNIENIEKEAWKNGIKVGENKKIMNFKKTIGASEDKETNWVLVKNIDGFIHGQPLDEKSLKKYFG